MKSAFYFYLAWYIATLGILLSGVKLSVEESKIMLILMYGSFAYLGFVPMYYLIVYEKSDNPKYVWGFMAMFLSRCVMFVASMMGLTDRWYSLGVTCFAVLMFVLFSDILKKKIPDLFSH